MISKLYYDMEPLLIIICIMVAVGVYFTVLFKITSRKEEKRDKELEARLGKDYDRRTNAYINGKDPDKR